MAACSKPGVCPVKSKVKSKKGGLVVPTGKPVAKPVAKRKRGQRKGLAGACEALGVVPFGKARERIGKAPGYRGKPVSRQHIYDLIGRRQLVQGVGVAGVSTVTKESLAAFMARLGEARS